MVKMHNYFDNSITLYLKFLYLPAALTTNNAAYLILKHGFPPTKWRELATALHHGGHTELIEADKHSSMSRLISVIKLWIANDDERSWMKLKEAMEMIGEPVTAHQLYKDTITVLECRLHLISCTITIITCVINKLLILF